MVQVNADDGHPYPRMPDSIIDRAFEWVAAAVNRVTTPDEKPKKPAAVWRKYVGKYRSPWGDTQVLLTMVGGQVAYQSEKF